MPLKPLALWLFVVLPVALFAQALTPQEAQDILRTAQKADRTPGSFKVVTVKSLKRGEQTTTKVYKILANGRSLSRQETVSTVTGKPEKTRTKISIRNEEGFWELRGNNALLQPPMVTQERIQEIAEAARKSAASGDKDAVKKTIGDDPLLAQAYEIWQHTHFSGERFIEDSKPRIKVVKVLDEEGQKVMLKMAKEQIAVAKKQLPFALRLLATPILAAIDLGARLPARNEYFIDASTGRLINTKTYNADGKLLSDSKPEDRVEIPDLPDSTFALPAGIKQYRPKDLGEYTKISIELERANKKEADTDAKKGSEE